MHGTTMKIYIPVSPVKIWGQWIKRLKSTPSRIEALYQPRSTQVQEHKRHDLDHTETSILYIKKKTLQGMTDKAIWKCSHCVTGYVVVQECSDKGATSYVEAGSNGTDPTLPSGATDMKTWYTVLLFHRTAFTSAMTSAAFNPLS